MKLAKLVQTVFLSLAFQFAASRANAQTPKPDDPPRKSNYSALVMRADDGVVLYERAANASRFPASTTKLMTAYLVLQALRDSTVTMDTKMRVSAYAASQPNTQMDLPSGSYVSISDALNGMLIHSANDASVVLAEKIGGSVSGFVKKMNTTAKELGMTNTKFTNPNGRTDAAQHTTLHDMAKLAIALQQEFPEYYYLFGQTEFTYRGRTYHNHNNLLESYEGMDGMKTGYIPAAGFNLVTSAERDGQRMLVLVFGAASKAQRTNDITLMMDYAFATLTDSTATYPPPPRPKIVPLEKLTPRPIELLPTPLPEIKIPVEIRPIAIPLPPERKGLFGRRR